MTPENLQAFIRVMDQHIRLYVNDYSLSPGKSGWQAIEKLEQTARCQDILQSA